jgi:hypothetical protein
LDSNHGIPKSNFEVIFKFGGLLSLLQMPGAEEDVKGFKRA